MRPEVSLETITPDMAQEMLRHNDSNRPIKNLHVTFLAKEIKEGRWKLNGATICFNGDTLIDGQHRLLAVIRAGRSIESFVVRSLSSDAFDTIDTGRKRSPGDVLAIDGMKSVHLLAGILRIVGCYYERLLPTPRHYSNNEIRKLLVAYPGCVESAAWAVGVTRCKLLTGSYWGAAHYIFSQLSADQAQEFLMALVTGANLVEGEPVQVLRQRLEGNLGAKAKYPKEYLLAFVIKAWNAARQGKTCSVLRYKFDSQSQEEFPVAM